MAGVGSAHHVLGVPHLLCQLGHGQCAVHLAAARGQGRKADHEEMEARERDQVDRQLAQVRIQLACTIANLLFSSKFDIKTPVRLGENHVSAWTMAVLKNIYLYLIRERLPSA